MATTPNPYDQLLSQYDDEQKEALRVQLQTARTSGKLNPAQMQSTGKLMMAIQSRPNAKASAVPFEQSSGPGAVARESILGAARSYGLESTSTKDILMAPAKGLYNMARHPIKTLEGMEQGVNKAATQTRESFKKGDVGLGVSQLAAGGIPVLGPQMVDLFQRIEEGKNDLLPERAGRAAEGVGIASQALLAGAKEIGPSKIAEAARSSATNMWQRLAGLDRAAVKFDPLSGAYVRRPGVVTQALHHKVYLTIENAAQDTAKIAKSLETRRVNAINRGVKAGVTVDASQPVGTLINEARAKITGDPELLSRFNADVSKLEASVGRRKLSALPIKEAENLNQLLKGFAKYESESKLPDFANLVRQVRHQVNEAIDTHLPGWSEQRLAQSDAMKMTDAFAHKIGASTTKLSPIEYFKSKWSPTGFLISGALGTAGYLTGHPAMGASAAGLLFHVWETTPSLTTRAAIMSAIARILKPTKGPYRPPGTLRVRGGAVRAPVAPIASPTPPVGPGPGVGPAPAPMPQPTPPGLPAAPAQAAPVPALAPPTSPMPGASAVPPPPTIPKAIQPAVETLQSYSASLEEKMQAANEVAKYASTDEAGKFTGPKGETPPEGAAKSPEDFKPVATGEDSPAKPAAKAAEMAPAQEGRPIVDRFAVYELPGGGKLKATYKMLEGSDTATLERIQIGQRTFKNKESMSKVLSNYAVDEAGLRAQLDQPASAELHGTGKLGKKAADAERKAEERAKARREQPDQPGGFTPQHYLEAVEAGYEAMVKQYGQKGRTIVNALKTVQRQKNWTAEETYAHLMQAIEALEKQGE